MMPRVDQDLLSIGQEKQFKLLRQSDFSTFSRQPVTNGSSLLLQTSLLLAFKYHKAFPSLTIRHSSTVTVPLG
jgi:hypothetical protein